MNERIPILDEDRIDYEAIASVDNETEVYASDEWLDEIDRSIAYYDVDEYDDDQQWLIDELLTLFVRAHRERDMGALEFVSGSRGVNEHLLNLVDIGLSSAAIENNKEHLFDLEPEDKRGLDDLDDITEIDNE